VRETGTLICWATDWVEEGDSILKAKVAVQFDITFEGGIYEDRDIKPMDYGMGIARQGGEYGGNKKGCILKEN